MIRRALAPFLLLLLTASAGVAADADTTLRTRTFLAAVGAYEQGQFEQAVEGFSALADDGVGNPDLYYNLGNAYWKSGDVGRAILWYERAALLAPGNPDLRYNLELARARTADAAEAEGANWARLLFFWRGHLDTHTLWLWAGILHLGFWATLAAHRFTGRRGLRHLATVCLVATLALAASSALDTLERTRDNRAIVLTEELVVRAGLSPDSTELFRLHAGSRVRVERAEAHHLRLRFGEDKVGWVPADAVGRIAP